MAALTAQHRRHIVAPECGVLTNLQRAQAGAWPQWMRDVAGIADNVKTRFAAACAAERAARPTPQAPAFDIDAGREELERLERSHSDSYLYADDRAEYQKGVDREQRINALRAAIAKATGGDL